MACISTASPCCPSNGGIRSGSRTTSSPSSKGAAGGRSPRRSNPVAAPRTDDGASASPHNLLDRLPGPRGLLLADRPLDQRHEHRTFGAGVAHISAEKVVALETKHAR